MQDYQAKIQSIHRQLGIADGYASRCGLDLQQECTTLVSAGLDVFGRERLMEARALVAWQAMKTAAQQDRIELQLVSAYRSAEYQQAIFSRKLAAGQSLEEILAVNAAPGFSEHHTGQALDLGCPDYEHLCEEFENSPAFGWLSRHAAGFGFTLSFPRDNPYGVLYEPWHWRYSPR